MRDVRAQIDLSAIAGNVRSMCDLIAPAGLCAVVKAAGYGHGSVEVGRAAIAAGAAWLGVALVEEAEILRDAGIDDPILLLTQPRGGAVEIAVRLDLRISVYTQAGIEAIADAARTQGRIAKVHLKVNTGMNRVGADRADALALARDITQHPELELEALWTHCAVADEPDNPFTDLQLDRFDSVAAELADDGIEVPMRHAANTAAAMQFPRSRYDIVRSGIGVYGIRPSAALADRVTLTPALALTGEVSMVKTVRAGERISYGLRHEFSRDTTVATVQIGYADGVPRRLSAVGGEVLIGGRRHPMVGTVTMDHLMVDCNGEPVAVGDPVVLIGRQGDEVITAEEWAVPLDTIAYEIICGIGPRVPRVYQNR
ncbi:MAG: alanine racemase [Actinomycetes bacterium]